MAEAGELVVKITADSSDFDKAMQKAPKTADTAMSSIAKNIASAAGSWKLFEAIGKGVEFNKAAEQAKVAFTVMTGSAEQAEKTLRSLKDYANSTPLEFADIRDATQTMLSFGIGADEAIGYIKQIGDVSGGNAEKMKSISLAFSQISATGRLTGQDLLQLINSGFNPLQEISDRTGKSMAELKKDMENGAISFDMVRESFKAVTSEGGRFYGMLEKQSQTLTGKVSTMNDAIDTALGDLTKAFEGPMKIGAEIMTDFAGAFSAMPAGIQATTGTVVALTAAVAGLYALAPKLATSLATSFGPLGIAAAAATAVIIGLIAELERAKQEVAKDVKNNFVVNVAESFGQVGTAADEANEKLGYFLRNLAKNKLTPEMAAVPGFFDDVARNAGVSTAVLAEGIIVSNHFSDAIKKIAEKYRDKDAAEKTSLKNMKDIATQYTVYAPLKEKEIKQTDVQIKQSVELAEKHKKAAEEHIQSLIKESDRQRGFFETREAEANQSLETIIRVAGEKIKIEKEAQSSLTSASEKGRIEREQKNKESIENASQEWGKFGSIVGGELEKLSGNFSGVANALGTYLAESAKGAFASIKVLTTSMADLAGSLINGIVNSIGDAYKSLYDKQIKDIEKTENEKISIIEKTTEATIDGIESADKLREDSHAGWLAINAEKREILQQDADFNYELIDLELQKTLESLGLAEETKIQKLIRERDEAIASGNMELAAEKERDIQKQKLIDEADAKKKALRDAESTALNAMAIEEKKRIKDEQDADIKATQEKEAAEKIAKKNLADAELEKEKKLAAIKYKADKSAWENNILLTTVNGIVAGVKAVAELGPVAGGIAAGVIAASTGIAIATIASNPPQMAAFAAGTDFAPGGMALVGEQGPELVNLPRGSQVFTNNETQDIMRRGGQGMQVTVNNYSPQALDPDQSAMLTRRSMRELSFQGAFA
jgi:tape measure domain-containing protein